MAAISGNSSPYHLLYMPKTERVGPIIEQNPPSAPLRIRWRMVNHLFLSTKCTAEWLLHAHGYTWCKNLKRKWSTLTGERNWLLITKQKVFHFLIFDNKKQLTNIHLHLNISISNKKNTLFLKETTNTGSHVHAQTQGALQCAATPDPLTSSHCVIDTWVFLQLSVSPVILCPPIQHVCQLSVLLRIA